MAKQKTPKKGSRAWMVPKGANVVEPEESTDINETSDTAGSTDEFPALDNIKVAIVHLQEAHEHLDKARIQLIENGGSVSRIVTAKQEITQILKNIKPYPED